MGCSVTFIQLDPLRKFSIINPLYFLGNGYIEGTELDGFLREFVSSANVSDVGPEVSPKAQIRKIQRNMFFFPRDLWRFCNIIIRFYVQSNNIFDLQNFRLLKYYFPRKFIIMSGNILCRHFIYNMFNNLFTAPYLVSFRIKQKRIVDL